MGDTQCCVLKQKGNRAVGDTQCCVLKQKGNRVVGDTVLRSETEGKQSGGRYNPFVLKQKRNLGVGVTQFVLKQERNRAVCDTQCCVL